MVGSADTQVVPWVMVEATAVAVDIPEAASERAAMVNSKPTRLLNTTTVFVSVKRRKSMANEAPIPPSLPLYEKPKERQPAVIPAGIEQKKLPGIMNKVISRMLPKMKGKMSKLGKMKTPNSKPGKKHKVTFK